MLKLESTNNPKDFILVKNQLSDSEVHALYKAITSASCEKLHDRLYNKDYAGVAEIATALDKLSRCVSEIENDVGNTWKNKTVLELRLCKKCYK